MRVLGSIPQGPLLGNLYASSLPSVRLYPGLDLPLFSHYLGYYVFLGPAVSWKHDMMTTLAVTLQVPYLLVGLFFLDLGQ